MTGDCGHPITMLFYVKCAKCLPDLCWTCTVINYTVLWQGYYLTYTFNVLKTSVETEIPKGSTVQAWIHRGRFV